MGDSATQAGTYAGMKGQAFKSYPEELSEPRSSSLYHNLVADSGMSANPHHDKMVSSLAEFMKNKGLTIIGIDVEGQTKPNSVGGSIPDVEARNSMGNPVFGEAEECDSIWIEHTLGQLRDFLGVPSATVYLSVPKECVDEANRMVAQNFVGRNIVVLQFE